MGRKKKKTQKPAQEAASVSTSMGSLLGGLGFAASDPSASPPAPAPEAPSKPDPLDMTRARNLKLRVEKKGRRGKSVTLLDGVSEAQSAAVAKALRKELGCGVNDKDKIITIQGAQLERVRDWLLKHGAKRVKGT